MYLNELSREQQQVFLILARQVMDADERLAMQELESLEAIYREIDSPSEIAEAPDVALDLNFTFDTARSRAVVFIELLLIANADGKVDDSENVALAGIADAMGMMNETRDNARKWVERFLELRREGVRIGLS